MIRKIYSFIRDNNIIEMIVVIALCSCIFFLRENINLKPQTVVYVNLIGSGVFLYILFLASRHYAIRCYYVVCILSILFVFNRFYDEIYFEKVFHFQLIYFVGMLFLLMFFVIIFPVLRKNFKKSSAVSKNNKLVNTISKEDTIIFPEEIKKVSIENNERNIINEKSNLDNNDTSSEKSKKLYSLLFIAFTLVVFGLSIGFIILITSSDNMKIMKKITSENLLSVMTSFIALLILLFFTSGMLISLLVKWFQIIIGIIKNQHEGEIYFLFAFGLALISQFVFPNETYTGDDIADFFLEGKIFTFPLVLSILIPVFLIFAENIVSFTKNNKEIHSALIECEHQTIKIAKGIVKSLLNFIEFATSDYLGTLIDFTKDDGVQEDKALEEGNYK